jgi:hypothetical protein
MNLVQLQKLSNEELRIKVALRAGWKFAHKNVGKNHEKLVCGLSPTDGMWHPPENYDCRCSIRDVPEYCTDLNAMHVVEKSLTDIDKRIYWRALDLVACRDKGRLDAIEQTICGVMASARDRAEAFILMDPKPLS